MPTIEQKPKTGIILQEFIYNKPSEHQLKTIFYTFGTKASLAPNITHGVIEGEWYDEKNGKLLAKASVKLWDKNSGIKSEILTETAGNFAECSQVTIFEVLPLR